MSYQENNSTETPLSPNQIYQGKPFKLDPKYITAQISVNTDQEGTLE